MRKLVLLAALMPALASAQAQQPVPSKFGYQGRLVDKGGAPLNGVHQVKFTIYKEATGGTPLWDETQKLALTNGFYSTFLGAVKQLPVGFDSNVFDGSDLYLGTAVDGTEELTPRQQIGAVVYALRTAWAVRAKDADHAGQADRATNVTGGGTVSATVIQNSAGSMRADANGNLHAVTAGIDGNLSAGSAMISQNLVANTLRNSGESFVAYQDGSLKAGNTSINGSLYVGGNATINGSLPGRVWGGGHAGCSTTSVILADGWGAHCSSSSGCSVMYNAMGPTYTLPGSYGCTCDNPRAQLVWLGKPFFLCIER